MSKTKEKGFKIWSNRDDTIDFIMEDMRKENPEMNDDELLRAATETNDIYLDDERANLSGLRVPTEIVCIGELHLWNGIRLGYKMVESDKLSDCLKFEKDCDYATWHVDERGDLRAEQAHHDGVNCLCYRGLRPGVTEEDIYTLCCLKRFNTEAEYRKALSRLTFRLGDMVQDVYGNNVKFIGKRPGEKLSPRVAA